MMTTNQSCHPTPVKRVRKCGCHRPGVGALTSEMIRQGVEGGFLGVTYSTSVQEILRSEMPQDAF
jgi:hypothetical protein